MALESEAGGDQDHTDDAYDDRNTEERDQANFGEVAGGNVARDGEHAGDQHGVEALNGVSVTFLGVRIEIHDGDDHEPDDSQSVNHLKEHGEKCRG